MAQLLYVCSSNIDVGEHELMCVVHTGALPAASQQAAGLTSSFSSALDSQPSLASTFDLVTQSSGQHDSLLSSTESTLQQSTLSSPPETPKGTDCGTTPGVASDRGMSGVWKLLGAVGKGPAACLRGMKGLGVRMMPCVLRKKQPEVGRQDPLREF